MPALRPGTCCEAGLIDTDLVTLLRRSAEDAERLVSEAEADIALLETRLAAYEAIVANTDRALQEAYQALAFRLAEREIAVDTSRQIKERDREIILDKILPVTYK